MSSLLFLFIFHLMTICNVEISATKLIQTYISAMMVSPVIFCYLLIFLYILNSKENFSTQYYQGIWKGQVTIIVSWVYLSMCPVLVSEFWQVFNWPMQEPPFIMDTVHCRIVMCFIACWNSFLTLQKQTCNHACTGGIALLCVCHIHC